MGNFIVVNPISYHNHGIRQQADLLHGWYTQSGNVMAMPFYAMHGPVLASQLFQVDATAKYQPPERSVLLVSALKKNAADPAWPMQAKYLQSPDLKA